MTAQFPCLECGSPYEAREQLELHWRANGHGPDHVTHDALDRARWSLTGEGEPGAAPPGSLDTDLAGDETSRPVNYATPRRRMRLIRGGRR